MTVSSRNARKLVATAISCLAFAGSAGTATATMHIQDTYGGVGTTGGLFASIDGPGPLAVNPTSGQLYVLDDGFHGGRVQGLAADGSFERAWGRDAIQSGKPGDLGNLPEICTVADDCSEGTAGTGDLDAPGGEIARVGGIAINRSGAGAGLGDVYVKEGLQRRISAYDADGNWIRSFGWDVVKSGEPNDKGTDAFEVCDSTAGNVATDCKRGVSATGAGAISSSAIGGIAIRQSDGAVFVGDSGGPFNSEENNRVSQYEADGTFVRAFGWGIDTGADAFEICTTASGCRHSSAEFGVTRSDTEPPENGEMLGPSDIAIDAAGVLYALEGDTAIYRFDTHAATPAGMVLALTMTGSNPPQAWVEKGWPASGILRDDGSRPNPEAIEVHQGSGHVFLLYREDEANETGTRIEEIDPAGPTLADTHMDTGNPVSASDFAIDEARDRIYVSGSGDPKRRIWVLEDKPLPAPPGVSIEAPEVNGQEATFKGTVTPGDPGGVFSSYRFEYSRDGVEWTRVPVPDQLAGEGSVAIPVSETVGGLFPNAEYQVRLVATRELGLGTGTSATLEFTTEAIPPATTTIDPRQRGSEEATLAARINPNNSPTKYRFEWGTDTSYGNAIPIPDGDAGTGLGERVVTATIAGLEPETTYHYRVVADNGVEVAPGDTKVEGQDVAFTTRATVPEPPLRNCPTGPSGPRCFEMVTPPFKAVRSIGAVGLPPRNNPNPVVPSLDGESATWQVGFLPLTDDVVEPLWGDKRIIRRTTGGWVNSTRNTLGLHEADPAVDGDKATLPPSVLLKVNLGATSADFETATWLLRDNLSSAAGLIEVDGKYASRSYTRRDGTGLNGFTSWLSNPEQQVVDQGFDQEEIIKAAQDQAVFNDDGSAIARWGHYRGVADNPATPADEDRSDNQQLPGQTGGSTVYLQGGEDADGLPSAPKDLVNECTGKKGGSGATEAATAVLARVGSGAATDTIGIQECARGTLTSPRGAVVGGSSSAEVIGHRGPNDGTAATALSDDGRRVYFQSPDHLASKALDDEGRHPSLTACATSTGANTACPPQLFLRSHDSSGKPIVRWISRSRSAPAAEGAYGGALIAGQRIGLVGGGAAFEGASRDGRVVYFKTNAPLTPDDPNGTGGAGPITTGSASNLSWDLYRYELPADPDSDPDDGTLLRVSGGPTGSADPATTRPSGESGVVRYHSDDGNRAYFLTTSPIPGADETPALGVSTPPGGTPGNTETRNLYLFDAQESGDERWNYIARIPFADDSEVSKELDAAALNICASDPARLDRHLSLSTNSLMIMNGTGSGNCFRGTPDGRAIAFATSGQVTGDDDDSASDVYLYDADEDEMVRISAPPQGVEPYGCVGEADVGGEPDVGFCNAELDRNTGGGVSSPIGPWEQSRGWAGMRYYNLSVDGDGVVSAYFASKLPLVPEDTNGDHMDVYQWRAGELSLISPGDEPYDAWFSGNSLDGEDVFFVSGQRIDPREIDPQDLDVYDARIGGGFPYTPPPTPCDPLAFECESQATPPPAAPSAPSASFSGPGNLKGKPRARCRKGKVRRKGRCVRRHAKKRHAKKRGAKKRGAKKRRAAGKRGRAGR